MWELARYDLKPKFLRIPGVARVELVGGQAPEYQVIVDPLRLAGLRLTLAQVTETLNRNNLVSASGLHQEDNKMYMTAVDGRVRSVQDIENLTITTGQGHPDPAQGFRPGLARQGTNVQRGHGGRSRFGAAQHLFPAGCQHLMTLPGSCRNDFPTIRKDMPPDVKLAFFLRSVAAGSRFDAQRVGGHHLRFVSFHRHSLPVPAELGNDVGRHGGDSRHRLVDDSGDETLRHEFQPDDTGRHCRGHRPDH